MKKVACLFVLLCCIPLFACSSHENGPDPIVTIEVEGYGEMVLELYFDIAPNTVRNFIHLVETGYYDGLTFHRVIEDFMIQGGRSSSSTCAIVGEFAENGVSNDLSHERGVISMARTTVKNSATSQFFIMHETTTTLDGKYAAFGRLLDGFTVLDAIATVPTDINDQPINPIIITKITIDTKGVSYDSPTCAD